MKTKSFKIQTAILLVWLCMFFNMGMITPVFAKGSHPIKKEEKGEYTLGKDDVITINVRRHDEFSGKFTIGSAGTIQFPYVGDINLKGLTKTEAEKKMAKIISKYVENPEVDITIDQFNSKVVYVFGLVARPGKYRMQGQFMPVREAILDAGLPRVNIAALRKAVIIRPRDKENPW